MNLVNEDVTHANIVLAGKYQLREIVGQGSFGRIFRACAKDTGSMVAVKVEKYASSGYASLARESKTLADLDGIPGFPSLHAFGREERFNFMVTTLLGSNLEKLLKLSGRKFSLKTVLMLADQMLTRIEAMHKLKYVHRDIKPENFVMGLGLSSKILFIIDFGLAKQYADVSGGHTSYKQSKGLIGTARYASINAHLGIEQTRRDDLEAIGYTLIYFLKGKLPWQNLPATTKQEKYLLIAEMKMKTPAEILCEDLPEEFAIYLNYVRKLGFDEAPDYDYLKKLFQKLFVKSGYDFDCKYDWTNQSPNSTSSKVSKFLFEEDSKNEAFFGPRATKLRKEPFGRPKMAHALNLKSKNISGFEEDNLAESEEEYVTTEKFSKGVMIEKKLRLANNLKRYEKVSSSENTSKALHISEIKPRKANEDELSSQEADMDDLLSRKFESFVVFQKMRSFENCGSQAERLLSFQKSVSFKLNSKVLPRQSHFAVAKSKDSDNSECQDENISESAMNEWRGQDALSLRIKRMGVKM